MVTIMVIQIKWFKFLKNYVICPAEKEYVMNPWKQFVSTEYQSCLKIKLTRTRF